MMVIEFWFHWEFFKFFPCFGISLSNVGACFGMGIRVGNFCPSIWNIVRKILWKNKELNMHTEFDLLLLTNYVYTTSSLYLALNLFRIICAFLLKWAPQKIFQGDRPVHKVHFPMQAIKESVSLSIYNCPWVNLT